MVKDKNKLTVIDGETLMDMKLPPIKFCVETLLPQGLCILGGASKIGKSWWVLDLCVRIAKGEAMWDFKTTKGTTLYLCLEDTLRRVQNRLLCITDEVPPNAFFATSAGTLADGLCEQIRNFVGEHTDTVFVAVDTFQIVRSNNIDSSSYANDYEEIRFLKQLADELDICLLLVHHLRKQGDSDPFNKLTGTTGIVGAVDTAFVLDKSKRHGDSATLYCTGRDVEDRQMELQFSRKDFVWHVLEDSMENRDMLLPKEMELLIDFMKTQSTYSGSNTEFAERYGSFSGEPISAKALKQLMNKWRYTLEEHGVYFLSHRSNGERILEVNFVSQLRDASAVSDAENDSATSCDPCVPCVPAGLLQTIGNQNTTPLPQEKAKGETGAETQDSVFPDFSLGQAERLAVRQNA